MALEGAFAPGARLTGRITTPGHEHVTMEITVERVEPEQLLSYRWHPYAVEPGVDYADEPTTLVEFRLAESPSGTRLTVVESGFDRHSAGAPCHRLPHERAGLGRAAHEHRALCRG